jgi:hypothetical protein
MAQFEIMEDGELDTTMKSVSSLVKEINARRVRWLGHLFRTNESM